MKILNHIKFHIKQILLTVDQAINVILFHGWADETISARCYRNRNKPFWKYLKLIVDKLFSPIKLNHCEESYLSEKEKRDLPPEYRII